MPNNPTHLVDLFDAIRGRHSDALHNINLPGESSCFGVWQILKTKLRRDQWQLAEIVAEISGLPVCHDLNNIDESILSKFPQRLAVKLVAIPVRKEGQVIVFAIANPYDRSLAEHARFSFGDSFRFEIAPPGEIEVAIAQGYAEGKTNKDKVLNLDDGTTGKVDEKEIPRLARKILIRALKNNASDIHLQPFVGGFAVRLRVDGLLQRLVILPDAVGEALIRYFKASGAMDPTNDRIPQDGRMSLEWEHQEIDLRISALPVHGGEEKLVIRLLNKAAVYDLHNTGMSLREIQTLRRMANNPSGVVLICGPTGSGKTTTLYSILSEKNDESVSIATIENPVEYNFPGLSQTEVNEKSGLSFASSLRALLRQDPDILLIGEIRDAETAQIAMQSALTGHLVFSTLHTNDSLAAIPRLLDLGVPGQILAQALTGIVSQRLFRKLCEHCREKVDDDLLPEESAFKEITQVKPPFRSTGCSHCSFSGYSGRLVVTEMVEMTTALVQLIERGNMSRDELKAATHKNMRSLAGAAARRIISGDTSCAEAARVIGRQFWLEIAKEYDGEIPDLGALESDTSTNASNQTAILLAGPDATFSQQLSKQLDSAWYSIFNASDPNEAKKQLQDHDHIRFVILDLPDEFSDEELVKYVADYRTAMAWSRLPAALLYSESRTELEAKLRADGATSRFISKPIDSAGLIETINSALARQVDFRWAGFAEENDQSSS